MVVFNRKLGMPENFTPLFLFIKKQTEQLLKNQYGFDLIQWALLEMSHT